MHHLHPIIALLFVLSTPLHAINVISSFVVTERLLDTKGLTLTRVPDPVDYRVVPGPVPGLPGIATRGEPLTVRAWLDNPVRNTGTLTFWFATDRTYRSGHDSEPVNHKLVEISDTLAVSFIADPTSITLIVEWGGPNEVVFPRHIRIILPEFPGPDWHHFAISWNGATGEINAFLNGTPYFTPGEKVPPLALQSGHELVLHLGPLAIAGVLLEATPRTASEIAEAIPELYRYQLDRLLGATDLGPLEAHNYRGEKIYTNSLSSSTDLRDWIVEGPAVIGFHAGGMEMRSDRPDGPNGHIVNWCPQEFPDRFVAEWEFELLEEKGLCILFFAATGKDGLDLFDPRLAPRSGIFTQYITGDIDSYHISYFANTPDEPRRMANLRKNRGFHLIANGPVGVSTWRPGRIHHALLIKDGPHIRMAVDGRLIIDHRDDGQRAGPAYTAGRIGFRQMQWTVARYYNFRLSTLK